MFPYVAGVSLKEKKSHRKLSETIGGSHRTCWHTVIQDSSLSFFALFLDFVLLSTSSFMLIIYFPSISKGDIKSECWVTFLVRKQEEVKRYTLGNRALNLSLDSQVEGNSGHGQWMGFRDPPFNFKSICSTYYLCDPRQVLRISEPQHYHLNWSPVDTTVMIKH